MGLTPPPFEQCSKKLHFSYTTASLIALWCDDDSIIWTCHNKHQRKQTDKVWIFFCDSGAWCPNHIIILWRSHWRFQWRWLFRFSFGWFFKITFDKRFLDCYFSISQPKLRYDLSDDVEQLKEVVRLMGLTQVIIAMLSSSTSLLSFSFSNILLFKSCTYKPFYTARLCGA